MNRRAVLSNGRITVVIPTYNRASLLPRAVETALGQTASARCDIIVVDDGSTDRTPKVVERYRDRVTYVRQPSSGAAVARNTGVRRRLNEFTAFLDDDDLWEPDKIERQLDAFGRWPRVVLVAGRSWELFPDGQRRRHPVPAIPFNQPADLAAALFEVNFLPTPTVMVRTGILLEVGLFHPGLRRCEDAHAWVRLACRGPCVYLDTALTTYSVGTKGLSADSLSLLSDELRVRYLLQSQLDRRPDCRPNWRRGLARSLVELREAAYRQRHYALAARYGLRSLLQQPRGRPRWEWMRFVESLLRAVTYGPPPGGRRTPASPPEAVGVPHTVWPQEAAVERQDREQFTRSVRAGALAAP